MVRVIYNRKIEQFYFTPFELCKFKYVQIMKFIIETKKYVVCNI